MRVVQLPKLTPEQFLNPTPTAKIAHMAQKSQQLPKKLSQNQMSEMKETKKMKVVQLHE